MILRLFLCGAICFVNAGCSNSIEKNEISIVVQRYHSALQTRNSVDLASTLAPSVGVKSPLENSTLTRNELVERITNSPVEIQSINVEEVGVSLNDSTATYSCYLNMEGILPTDFQRTANHTANYNYTLVKNLGRWEIRIIEQQN
jgi:hypothetical protein